jgi:16S rRNA (cytidine1402-2'-O)-methyltransferase
MKGILYLVATPIGNLSDITYRAIETLKNVDLIAAEDTRQTLKLLNHYEISKPLISYYRHNEDIKANKLIEELLSGKNIALVSDAGTPGISDPGEELVKEAIENEITICPIPGACAFINALIISGINTKEFAFYGFLPMNKKNRKEKLEEISKENKTIILYEAPHKIKNTLQDLYNVLGNINCVIARELTKIHEECCRGTIEEMIEKFQEPKGEFVIILDLNNNKKDDIVQEMTIEELYEIYINEGLNKKEAIKKIAKDKKLNKNEVYKHFI